MREIGIVTIGLAAVILFATKIVHTYAAGRKNTYGIEGENLRLQPNRVALVGVMVALFLVLAGGLLVGVAAL